MHSDNHINELPNHVIRFNFQSDSWWCFVVDLLMQHKLWCCVNLIGRSWRMKNKLNYNHINFTYTHTHTSSPLPYHQRSRIKDAQGLMHRKNRILSYHFMCANNFIMLTWNLRFQEVTKGFSKCNEILVLWRCFVSWCLPTQSHWREKVKWYSLCVHLDSRSLPRWDQSQHLECYKCIT